MNREFSSKPTIRNGGMICKIASFVCVGSFLSASFFLLLAGAITISIVGSVAQCYLASETIFAQTKPLLTVIPMGERSSMTVARAFPPANYPAALKAVEQVYGVTSTEYIAFKEKYLAQ